MTRKIWNNGVLVLLEIDGIKQEITDEIRKQHPSKRKPSEWPLWAKAFKAIAKPEDKGIGDVVARLIGDETSSAFKAWHLATFGKPCNCNGRQTRWNRLYPLQ